MPLDVSEPAAVGRVAAFSDDRLTMFVQLAAGGVATVTNDGGFGCEVGDVLLLRAEDNHLETAPDSLWHDSGENQEDPLWLGTVKARFDDVSVIDTGGGWRRVRTSGVSYTVGNTVEGSDARGVVRVLDEKPLRHIDRSDLDEVDISHFRLKPTGDLGFEDFGGLRDVVKRAQELIELPIEKADKLRTINAGRIGGVLFTGAPGTGKTMLARIIANRAKATFYKVSGPEVFSKWMGESEQVLRRIFEDAAEHAPSIIFFDEIDSVAGQRDEDAHEMSKRVVTQLLTLMDDFISTAEITVIAATNRPQDIDKALRRPGRFDWQLDFPLPKEPDRLRILEVSSRPVNIGDELPHEWVAAHSDGWSAAQLTAIWREAALLAAADDRDAILREDYLGGFERVAVQRDRISREDAEAT